MKPVVALMDLNLVKGELPPVGPAILELVDIDLPNAEEVHARKISPAAVYLRHSVVRLISSELGPMADSGPDLCPNRVRLTQQDWWASVAQCQ
jgi:hypothetical protein